jgi:hypothetical protein
MPERLRLTWRLTTRRSNLHSFQTESNPYPPENSPRDATRCGKLLDQSLRNTLTAHAGMRVAESSDSVRRIGQSVRQHARVNTVVRPPVIGDRRRPGRHDRCYNPSLFLVAASEARGRLIARGTTSRCCSCAAHQPVTCSGGSLRIPACINQAARCAHRVPAGGRRASRPRSRAGPRGGRQGR